MRPTGRIVRQAHPGSRVASLKTNGACSKCGKVFAHAGMGRHLAACLGPGTALHVALDAGPGTWWMHIALAPTATLRDLDHFLRATWLECCGHLRAFEIGPARFESTLDPGGDYWGPKPRSMAAKANAVLQPGMTFRHEYDFGSTTQLRGRVYARVAAGRTKVELLARNEPITWPCSRCGAVATLTCPYCGELACDGCPQPCDCRMDWPDQSLPVVNSPRMGVCAYVG